MQYDEETLRQSPRDLENGDTSRYTVGTTMESGFGFKQWQSLSRPTMGHTQPPDQLTLEALSPEDKVAGAST